MLQTINSNQSRNELEDPSHMVRDRCGTFHRPIQSERAEFLGVLGSGCRCDALNGYIATIEDDWPGGFNNPDPQPSSAQRRIAQITELVLRSLFGKSR